VSRYLELVPVGSTSPDVPGEAHDASKNSGAVPSFCTLPLFHQPAANSAMADSVNGRLRFARRIDKTTC